MFSFSILLATGLALASQAAAYANPLPCSGVCTDTHDPSLIQRSSDGKYFRFSTGGGIDIHTASTIQGPWSSAGEVLSGGSSINNAGANDAWAPDVHKIGNTYYLYYAVSSFGTQISQIGVATSTSMDAGSWTDHGATGLQSKSGDNFNAIDPNLIIVGGKNYMNFGSFWADIFQTTFSSDYLTWSGSAPTDIELNTTSPQPSEGSYMVQNGNYYYLFFSSGICCNYDQSKPAPGDEYKIMVCRSSSVTGPFTDANGKACLQSGGTQVLGSHGVVYGPGGQGVYQDAKLGSVLYYHYVNTTVGYADSQKQLGINVLDWSSGWPTVDEAKSSSCHASRA